ncbi:MAG: hypothetical protein ACR2LT_04720 [Pyrinomonadaceae bacterium]
MIKILKQLLFITIITLCASFAAFAQKNDGDKKPPPKDPPPVIVVKPKEKDSDKPKDDNGGKSDKKPKKPASYTPDALQLVEIIFDKKEI